MKQFVFILSFLIFFESSATSTFDYYRPSQTTRLKRNVGNEVRVCGTISSNSMVRKVGSCARGWCKVATPGGACGGWAWLFVGRRGERAVRHRISASRLLNRSGASPQVMTTSPRLSSSNQTASPRTSGVSSELASSRIYQPSSRAAPDLHLPAQHRRSRAGQFINYCKRNGLSESFCSQVTYPTLHSRGTFNRTYPDMPFLLVPPEADWAKAISLLRNVEQAGGCIKEIRNWFRPEPYNRNVRGKSRSSHKDSSAIDIHYCSLSEKYKALRKFRRMRSQTGKPAGIGTYGSDSFTIHIDLRPKTYGSDVYK